MGGLLFGLVLVVAVGVFAARAFKKGSKKKHFAEEIAKRPGYSAAHPVRISSFDEIDDAIATWRCPCGGLLDRIGEGSRPGLRVVRCACVICEEDVDLFFDLRELRH
ncbi:MAG: hypothetical protein QM765_31690 [Myxococcales bacterium]